MRGGALLLIVLFGLVAVGVEGNATVVEEMVPVAAKGEMMAAMMMKMDESNRRRLRGRFQVCSLCTCCGGGGGGGRSYCTASPCCYAINCNIPNRPFGYCSFTPKTCNCFGCHI
ncbi:uncharacterized protein LOC127243719 [Andrographis paniculata]|uniref:uncharacterized protein LOC127243719 n=1 Tax=Andrographis paniculata TaxID=175694 RepID=UPI0021E7A0F0|nr:uncharacterized protein LOC127243719 [Andrographis paniculata]